MSQLAIASASTTSESTFKTMVRAVGGLLQSFKDDLLIWDKKELARTWFQGAEYCLHVRKTGTAFCLLHVHPVANEWVEAAVDTSDDPDAVVFHVRDGKAVRIDKVRALELLHDGQAQFDGFMITYRGRELASYRLERFYLEDKGKNRYEVKYDSRGNPLSFEDLIVLEIMARVIVRKDARSLFYFAPDVFLDDENIYPLIDRKRGS